MTPSDRWLGYEVSGGTQCLHFEDGSYLQLPTFTLKTETTNFSEITRCHDSEDQDLLLIATEVSNFMIV
jgi:hypothetical protein